MKCKGISLNYMNKQVVNYNVLRNMIVDKTVDEVKVKDTHKIVRDKKKMELLVKEQEKVYRVVYTKRRILDDGVSTLPYGY